MTQPTADYESLPATLAHYDIELPLDQATLLARYCELLWRWNEKLNLTRHTDFDRFVARDVNDAVELSKLLKQGEEILDVGTGGGMPGILLAIMRPDLKVSLCESVGKKVKAVDAILGQLSLNCALFHGRAESVLEDFRFDSLVARAVGPLWKMCHWFRPHWHLIGRLLAIKGPKWTEERAEARHRGLMTSLELRRLSTYPMLGTDSQSVILQIRAKPS